MIVAKVHGKTVWELTLFKERVLTRDSIFLIAWQTQAIFAIEKDKSRHERGKLPSIKSEILLSWVKVGASSQQDTVRYQQKSNPILRKLHCVLQHSYKDSQTTDTGLDPAPYPCLTTCTLLDLPTLSRSYLLLLFTFFLSQPNHHTQQ